MRRPRSRPAPELGQHLPEHHDLVGVVQSLTVRAAMGNDQPVAAFPGPERARCDPELSGNGPDLQEARAHLISA